jgi:hypothetical protein
MSQDTAEPASKSASEPFSSVDQITYRRMMRSGVTAHDPDLAEPGYVLFSPPGDDGTTVLIDMEGNVVHQWHHDLSPGAYGYLLPNGNLFYNAKWLDDATVDIFEVWPFLKGGEMSEVTPEGDVVWRHREEFHHHDGRRTAGGGALWLSLERLDDEFRDRVRGGHRRPDTHQAGDAMYADVFIEIDADGAEIWRWHAREHLDVEIDVLPANEPRWEWTHGNSIAPLGDDRIVFSMRNTSTVGIIDKGSGRVIWRWLDEDRGGQHDARPLENGNILIFDNGTQKRFRGAIPFSRVVEVNPVTDEIEWIYTDSPPHSFRSPHISGSVRLAGGNTMICEGLRGRIFQVTPGGQVVWEYVSPFYGSNGRGALVNTVFRAFHYRPDEIPWL